MSLRLKAFLSFVLFAVLLGGIAAPYTSAVRASSTASSLFTPEEMCAGYVDVPSSHVEYCQALKDLKGTGAAGGYPDGFHINESVTRQQFAKMIVVHFGGALVDPNTTPQHFADVPRSNVFFQWIETALQRGWMSGVQGDPNYLN
ncbi:MAG TPA: S-layer homology domain-containing protein, partial [Chloroflexia bacterium]